MKNVTRYAGFDVHADTIAVAVAEEGRDGEVRQLGLIPNRLEAIRKLVQKLGTKGLRVGYEAGPTGYVLYWQLVELGVACEVVAPTLVPVKAGDRVKTDGRDAVKLARCLRAGELTAVWLPDQAHEALRDLVRARASAKKDQLRARHRLSDAGQSSDSDLGHSARAVTEPVPRPRDPADRRWNSIPGMRTHHDEFVECRAPGWVCAPATVADQVDVRGRTAGASAVPTC